MIGNDLMGQIRLESEASQARLSYSVAAEFRGRGLAPVLLNHAIRQFRQESTQRIYAETRFENNASANALMCAGFMEHTAENDSCRKFILE